MGIKETVLGDTRKSSINSKNKGNINERAVAKWLSSWTRKEFVRTPQSGGIRWQNSLGLNICGDVVCTEQGYKFPFTVETKHLKGISFIGNNTGILRTNTKVLTIFVQASRDAIRDNREPLIMLRCNGMPANTWWVFFNYSVVYKHFTPKDRILLTPDKELMGIHSDDLKQYNYDDLFHALHRRKL